MKVNILRRMVVAFVFSGLLLTGTSIPANAQENQDKQQRKQQRKAEQEKTGKKTPAEKQANKEQRKQPPQAEQRQQQSKLLKSRPINSSVSKRLSCSKASQ